MFIQIINNNGNQVFINTNRIVTLFKDYDMKEGKKITKYILVWDDVGMGNRVEITKPLFEKLTEQSIFDK